MNGQNQEPHPIVAIIGNHVATTSLSVAACFDKRHDNVMRDIKNLEVPEEFGRLNFEESNYLNEQGKAQPMYEITRDGFTLLAFGFHGPKAMRFKLAYIDAFNRMETELQRLALEASAEQVRRARIDGMRKGMALNALLDDRFAKDKVEEFFWFRNHGHLTHVEAAFVCGLKPQQADEISRTLKESGFHLPSIQGQVRKRVIGEYFAEAAGGFLPEEITRAIYDTPKKEVAHV